MPGSDPNIWAIVPAAGIGQRMQADIPKQYLQLGDALVIEHAISALLSHPRIQNIVVALAKNDTWWSRTAFSDHEQVSTVHGGDDRAQSVLNALKSLSEKARPQDWILVHDAARPCLQLDDLEQLIESLSDTDQGALLAIPVNDTTKISDQQGQVSETIDRSHLWRAFTPQVFPFNELQNALVKAQEQGLSITDESSAMEAFGFHPKLVRGKSSNIKITEPEDLALAKFYLELK